MREGSTVIHTVTIEWQGAEIGFGEGESEAFARTEAIESVPGIYGPARAEWKFIHHTSAAS
jgi:hypothetical protein